jgi:hypothetical protein
LEHDPEPAIDRPEFGSSPLALEYQDLMPESEVFENQLTVVPRAGQQAPQEGKKYGKHRTKRRLPLPINQQFRAPTQFSPPTGVYEDKPDIQSGKSQRF